MYKSETPGKTADRKTFQFNKTNQKRLKKGLGKQQFLILLTFKHFILRKED